MRVAGIAPFSRIDFDGLGRIVRVVPLRRELIRPLHQNNKVEEPRWNR